MRCNISNHHLCYAEGQLYRLIYTDSPKPGGCNFGAFWAGPNHHQKQDRFTFNGFQKIKTIAYRNDDTAVSIYPHDSAENCQTLAGCTNLMSGSSKLDAHHLSTCHQGILKIQSVLFGDKALKELIRRQTMYSKAS